MYRKGMALVAMVIVLPTVTVMCADGDSDDHISGAGGLKEAIQDLYAEIIASESDGGSGVGGDSSASRLDDVASAKAKFVSDSLRRMIGSIDTTDGTVIDNDSDSETVEWKLRSKQKEMIDAIKRYEETHGVKVSERAAKHVNWLMDKCMESIALRKNEPVDGTETTAAAVKQIKHDDMCALQKCFDDWLDRFEQLRMSDVTAVNRRGIYGHRSSTTSLSIPRPPPTPRPPPPSRTPLTTKPPPTPQRTTRLVGRFKFKQFTNKQPRVEIAKAVTEYQ
ncbi:unnamed protein product [Macrosiphum euphorbiae]|uniref:Uncharacterized protein n=1 Tax=Macrosiphum euphorbiae TaxID=13131 RepID=A0AAV0WEV9_9HEMI|nr:unnamed protein product [Macrosiphum euphorbiae]